MVSQRAALLAALMLQRDFGADEALDAKPLDRTARPAPAEIARPVTAEIARPAPAELARAAPAVVVAGAPPPPVIARATALAAAADSVEALRATMAGFDGSPLRDTATSLVFADGQLGTDVLLLGDAPGAEEDRSGRAFTGATGQLLERMLRSIDLDRTGNCALATILPWRPPGDRPPTEAEFALFLPFVLRLLALAPPRRLLLLGGAVAKAVLGSREPLSRLRGRNFQVMTLGGQDVRAVATLHPGQVMQRPAWKCDMWTDLILLRRSLSEQ